MAKEDGKNLESEIYNIKKKAKEVANLFLTKIEESLPRFEKELVDKAQLIEMIEAFKLNEDSSAGKMDYSRELANIGLCQEQDLLDFVKYPKKLTILKREKGQLEKAISEVKKLIEESRLGRTSVT